MLEHYEKLRIASRYSLPAHVAEPLLVPGRVVVPEPGGFRVGLALAFEDGWTEEPVIYKEILRKYDFAVPALLAHDLPFVAPKIIGFSLQLASLLSQSIIILATRGMISNLDLRAVVITPTKWRPASPTIQRSQDS